MTDTAAAAVPHDHTHLAYGKVKRNMKRSLTAFAISVVTVVLGGNARGDTLDEYVQGQMRKYSIPGLSMAIVRDGKIAETRCYGVVSPGSKRRVTPDTLFQAGSISKTVTAVAALKLVERGVLSLDEDVNIKLRTWKVPASEFTREHGVTLRRLLSHSAGMTVRAFEGYPADGPVPSLRQILDGELPANNLSIRVDTVPGTVWKYSGGGYTVVQQLLVDVTGQSFPDLLQKSVFEPLGMTNSSFAQPPPSEWAARAAAGTVAGEVVNGRWRLHPQMAAAGLWTTPTDLARFMASIQRSLTTAPAGILSRSTATEMLTIQKRTHGLGVRLNGKNETLQFSHGGTVRGFDSLFIGYAETGQGLVVMMNTNEGQSDVLGRIAKVVASEYKWPDSPRFAPIQDIKIARTTSRMLDALTGYFTLGDKTYLLTRDGDRLRLLADSILVDELIPQEKGRYLMPDAEKMVSFSLDSSGQVIGMSCSNLDGANPVFFRRVCHLLGIRKSSSDPQADRLARIRAVLPAVAQGRDALTNLAYLTPELKKAVFTGCSHLKNLDVLSFLGEEDLTETEISRLNVKIARVAGYRVKRSGRGQFLIVFFTADNRIADFDLVDE